jgi:tetratricopeptide (TPR) repeat protein
MRKIGVIIPYSLGTPDFKVTRDYVYESISDTPELIIVTETNSKNLPSYIADGISANPESLTNISQLITKHRLEIIHIITTPELLSYPWLNSLVNFKLPLVFHTINSNTDQQVIKYLQNENEVVTENKKLRVLFQNRPHADSHPGGDTVVMNQLAKELTDLGVEVVIDHQLRTDIAKFDIVHLFNFVLPDLLRAQAENAVKANVPYVVTAICEDFPLFLASCDNYANHLIHYVQQNQIKDSYTWSASDRHKYAKVPLPDNNWVVNHAARIFTWSETESISVRNYSGANEKLYAVNIGFDRLKKYTMDECFAEFGVRDFILCIGRLEARKNQLALLKALEDTDDTIVLATGGFTYQPEYAEAVKKFRRSGKVITLGRLTSDQLSKLICGASVHVLPSWYELPGLVTFEAAYLGCPVVATKLGSCFDYLGNSITYCEPDNIESIKNSVYNAIYNPQVKIKLENLSWNNTAKNILNHYNQIISTTLTNIVTVDKETELKELINQGELAAKQQEYYLAHELLNKARNLQPNSPRVLRSIGVVHLTQSQSDQARTCFLAALAITPNDAKCLCGLGMSLQQLGNIEEAHTYFIKACNLNPYDVVTIYHLMQTSYQLRKFSELSDVLARYCQEKHDDIEHLYCYAGCLYQEGRKAEATSVLQKILKIDPEHLSAKGLAEALGMGLTENLNSIANTTLKRMELEDAKKRRDYSAVITGVTILLQQSLTEAEKTELRCLNAETLLLIGQWQNGEVEINHLKQEYPKHPRVLCLQAACAGFNNDWSQARMYFDEALKVSPNYENAIAGIGACLHQENKFDEAWHQYLVAIKINPESKRALLGLIELARSIGRWETVEEYLESYLELHPADLDILFAMSECCVELCNYEKAQAQLQKLTIFQADYRGAKELQNRINIHYN